MTTNRLAVSTGTKERITPPKDEQERIDFWIARGNFLLEEMGKHHLHWIHRNGAYSIEDRPRVRAITHQTPALGDER